MNLTTASSLLRMAARAFIEDKAPRLGAALAYYSVFSMAPLLLIAVSIAGLVFGHDAALGHVANQMQAFIGRENAEAVQQMIQKARAPSSSAFSTVVSVIMLIVGAAGVFFELKSALNTIWGVAPRPDNSIWLTIGQTFLPVTAVLGTGFLLLVSLLASAALAAISHFFGSILPGGEGLWSTMNVIISFVIVTTLFALIFRYLPDARVAWPDVAIGALLTAVLFEIGKFLLGQYIGSTAAASPFGAAGSLAVLLIWVYYSSQILFFGAEFTKVYANQYGSHIVPNDDALLVSGVLLTRGG